MYDVLSTMIIGMLLIVMAELIDVEVDALLVAQTNVIEVAFSSTMHRDSVAIF